MESHVATFLDYLLTPQNLLIVVAVWGVLGQLRKSLRGLHKHPAYARVLPLLPLVMCELAVWVPGAVAEGATVGERVFLGIVLGLVAAHGNKLLRQTILGRDRRIPTKAP